MKNTFSVWSAVALTVAATFWGPAAHAAREFDFEKYSTIATVQTQEIPDDDAPVVSLFSPKPALEPGSVYLFDIPIGEIISIGKDLWELVKDNAPSATATTDHADALPKGVDHWEQLSGWKPTQSRKFRTTMTNFYGADVVDFEYRVSYVPGGSVRGKGQYLANVSAIPTNVRVLWGYKLNARATVPSVVNAGSSQKPVAQADLLVQWTVDTILSSTTQSAEYEIRGDGGFQALP